MWETQVILVEHRIRDDGERVIAVPALTGRGSTATSGQRRQAP
jgi:hypothetical protein